MSENLPARPPKKWKMAIMVWLAIYPLITLILVLFGTELNKVHPTPLRTLILTAVLVPIMVFLVLPFIQKVFAKWLRK